MTITYRPSTPEDFVTYLGEMPHARVRAFTGLVDGKIVAIGGIAYLKNGTPLAWLDADDIVREKYKLSLVRAAKEVMRDHIKRGFQTVNSICDPDMEAAPRFLERLGFKPVDGSPGIYTCEVS